ncbi:MAG: hypothetical protein H6742_13480 [Alphaproteobacteria bacterium]|nr:hypothetical protein [Alphaproteobacteria bacterium]
MDRRAFACLPLALLFACSSDFTVKGVDPTNRAEDTGTPAAEEGDTGAAEEVEEEDPPVDEPEDETGLPEEEEEEVPVEETPDEEPPPEDDCTETDDRIYVIEREGDEILIFDPETLGFESLGRLRCDGARGATPASMAVGRDGIAWVRMSDDKLYEVSLDDLACTPTDFRLPSGFGSFGMGFATEHDGTWRDHLFIADADTLGMLDVGALSVETVGRMASQSELTGNAAGELWAFLPLESPAELAQLDQDDGSRRARIPLPMFPSPADIDTFAFATWGGEFWLFVRTYGMGSSTDVYRVDADGAMTRVLVDVGFDVVGAGVSTCAPTE